MNRLTRKVAVFACFALLLTAAGCGGGGKKDEGAKGSSSAATKEPIKIGGIFDLSGATKDVGTPYSEGIRDYVDYRNKEGGIDGHNIELSWQDFGYKVDQGTQLYSQYVSQGAVAFMGWGTADTEALRPRVTSDQIPFMSASYAATLADPKVTPYNFFPGASYSEQMRIALKYIGEQNKGHVEVAVFHNDSPFGTSPLEDGKKYIADNKLNIGFKAYPMAAGATDFVAQLQQAKAQGAKYVIIQNVPTPSAKLAQNIKAQNLDMQIVCMNWCGDEIYVNLAGPAAEKTIAVMPFAPPSAGDLAGLKEISDYLKTKGGDINAKGLRYVQGWFTMSTMAEGISNALKDLGDKKLDGPGIKAGLEKVSGFKTGGVSEPISFSAESHAGLKAAPLYQVQSGKWAKLTDPLKA
jgi:branched-chain amino acid transport system substrate-binding protein